MLPLMHHCLCMLCGWDTINIRILGSFKTPKTVVTFLQKIDDHQMILLNYIIHVAYTPYSNRVMNVFSLQHFVFLQLYYYVFIREFSLPNGLSQSLP